MARTRVRRPSYLGNKQIIWYRAKLQNQKCYLCSCKMERFPCEAELHRKATIDHVVPRVRNGRNNIFNTLFACHPCNRRKRDRMPYVCELMFLEFINEMYAAKVGLLHGVIPKPIEFIRCEGINP